MSYDNEKLEFGKEHINIVEIDLEYCENDYGIAPCTATGAAGTECFNTFSNCQDLPNFVPEIKTYRFCEGRSPHPIGLQAIPSLTGINISPAKIALSGGLGTRASVSLSFNDHPFSDIGVDKYVSGRSYIASERGSFWTKLRARNPNYQNGAVRVLSGYLINGKYDPANFITRNYVLNSMDVSGGRARIVAKDPLKLASSNKALAPKANTGVIETSLSVGAGHLILLPAGIGAAEYATAGFISLRNEVLEFTRVGTNPDRLDLTRAQKNTVATTHEAGETVQQCLDYSGQTRGKLDFIINDLLTNFAFVDPAFINTNEWAAEIAEFLSGLADGIVTKPFDVFKLLQELSESFPHYLWWNEKTQKIELTALKPPPPLNAPLDMDKNIVAGSFTTKDRPDMRTSTIFVNFGMFDQTKKLNDIHNYRQSYTRVDAHSIATYGSSEVRVVNSRWINDNNKAQAVVLATLYGRRFSDIPREISFDLEAKDSNVWIGQTKAINHFDIADETGSPKDTNFQIMTAKESDNYKYTALEYTYGPLQAGDFAGGNLIYIPNGNNQNMRDIFNGLFPAPDATTEVLFVIDNGVVVGGTTPAGISLDTGSWPAGAVVKLAIEPDGYLLGSGGDEGSDGGLALLLSYDLVLNNSGVIGGGGGGGGFASTSTGRAGGGGGAGFDYGVAGPTVFPPGGFGDVAQNGTLELGGRQGAVFEGGLEPDFYEGGFGGNLAQDGTVGAGQATSFGPRGVAGPAISKAGFTLDDSAIPNSDIRGVIIP